ncbi:putative 1,4-beta-D-xylan synthase [Dioscorea sansibarensis]
MGTSFDRSKKRIQLWKKALLQFSLCFVMGFFSGFAPTTTTSSFFSSSSTSTSSSIFFQSPQPILSNTTSSSSSSSLLSPPSLTSIQPSLDLQIETEDSEDMAEDMTEDSQDSQTPEEELQEQYPIIPNKLLIIVTTTSSRDPIREVKLRRLSHTLSLVDPPLLWIVVEDQLQAPKTAETLRKTGVMYRHLTVKENFTDHPATEADFQRNLALNHIEHHRLNGIVHFASLSNVYDLHFFQEIRDIEVFGTWPVAMLGANRKRVLVEGPICNSLQVVGWRKKDFSKGGSAMSYYFSRIQEINNNNNNNNNNKGSEEINISGFAFNSSILWDPERWGRSSSGPRNSQDSIKFVQQVVLEDETKLRAIPSDCSKIMLWNFHVPRNLTFYQTQTKR